MNAIAFGWMHTWQKRRPEIAVEPRNFPKRVVAILAECVLLVLFGCASPGPPLPPSLKLPEIVTDLSASRVGDHVTLHWTTPARTTDKVLIAGDVTAEICRDMPTGNLAPMRPAKPTPKGQSRRKPAARIAISPVTPCSVLLRLKARPGESQFADALPESLTSGSPAVIAYRVQLLNSAGRTAGPSNPAYVASGPAPEPVRDLRGTASKRGVVLEWNAEGNAGSADAIELKRIAEDVPAAPTPAPKNGLPSAPREQAESRFRTGGSSEAVGTVDRTAVVGRKYRYTAKRVRTVTLGDHTLEVQSLPSAEVAVAMNDVFPPEPPVALIAVPGYAGDTDTQKPTIDLSWDPDMEPRISGYRVYRRDPDRDASAWKPLGTELTRVASYRDLDVVAGKRYAYRVTAVSDAGNESAPSGDVIETAPAP
jgi:hypothetical protein